MEWTFEGRTSGPPRRLDAAVCHVVASRRSCARWRCRCHSASGILPSSRRSRPYRQACKLEHDAPLLCRSLPLKTLDTAPTASLACCEYYSFNNSFIYSPDDYSAISEKTMLQATPDNLEYRLPADTPRSTQHAVRRAPRAVSQNDVGLESPRQAPWSETRTMAGTVMNRSEWSCGTVSKPVAANGIRDPFPHLSTNTYV